MEKHETVFEQDFYLGSFEVTQELWFKVMGTNPSWFARNADGANEVKMFFKVILPLIIPSILIITVLTIIGSLNVFEQIYTMAGLDGSPNFSTDTIGTLFYRTAFGSVDSGNPEIGIGSAIGVVIYFLTFAASVFSIVSMGKKEVEL